MKKYNELSRNGFPAGFTKYAAGSVLLAVLLFGVTAGATTVSRTEAKSTAAVRSGAAGMERVKSFGDGVCSVTNVVVGDVKRGIVRVDFVLRPEPGSDIRCRVEMPRPEAWDGRLWGVGNSGQAGKIPKHLRDYSKRGSAVVSTDLGTWAWVTPERVRLHWPECVRRDFDWRATHLMAVYGRKIVELFYGRPPRRMYFNGGSTGGRQALSEAIRFPEDFDGIIARVCANMAVVNEAAIFHLWRATHDSGGKALFTPEQMTTVADAAVEYMKTRDPAPYAGEVVADGRWSESDIEGFLKLAAKNDASLAPENLQARLKSLYMPLYVDGRCAFTGFAPGTNHRYNMNWIGLIRFKRWLNGKGLDIFAVPDAELAKITWKQFNEFVSDESAPFNSCSPDLSRFAARGGKLMITAGWEDQTVPPGPLVEYYERVCAAMGGLEKTMEFCRFYCFPGAAHGGGKGRKRLSTPGEAAVRRIFADWCEKGVAPESYRSFWKKEKLAVPTAAYPKLMVREKDGAWKCREQPRTKPVIDPFYIQCDVSPWLSVR